MRRLLKFVIGIFGRRNLMDESRTSPTGLWMYGQAYFEAAAHLSSADLRFDAPQYFLYAHSIELALKAHLRAKGATLDRLMKTGHNLPKLLKQARKQGLVEGSATSSNMALIKLLHPYNRSHQFRYIVTGFKTLPELRALHEIADGLLKATRASCMPATKPR